MTDWLDRLVAALVTAETDGVDIDDLLDRQRNRSVPRITEETPNA